MKLIVLHCANSMNLSIKTLVHRVSCLPSIYPLHARLCLFRPVRPIGLNEKATDFYLLACFAHVFKKGSKFGGVGFGNLKNWRLEGFVVWFELAPPDSMLLFWFDAPVIVTLLSDSTPFFASPWIYSPPSSSGTIIGRLSLIAFIGKGTDFALWASASFACVLCRIVMEWILGNHHGRLEGFEIELAAASTFVVYRSFAVAFFTPFFFFFFLSSTLLSQFFILLSFVSFMLHALFSFKKFLL